MNFIKILKTQLLALVVIFVLFSNIARTSELPSDVVKQIETQGLVGLIHGADPETGLYLLSYHLPGDFFARYTISLYARSRDTQIKETLSSLHRGDKVEIVGLVGGQETPQPHVRLIKITLLKAYVPVVVTPKEEFKKTLITKAELQAIGKVKAIVHAVGGEGKVVVIEYADNIFPLVVSDTRVSKDLYRGDLVEVEFNVQSDPRQPIHLDAKSIKVLEQFKDLNEKEVTYEGRLTLFPASPTISRDVWALEFVVAPGLSRYFTLVNFEPNSNGDLEEFDKIDAKLREAWTAQSAEVLGARNKFINLKVKVRAHGKVSVVSAAQANAQIHLKADDIQFFE